MALIRRPDYGQPDAPDGDAGPWRAGDPAASEPGTTAEHPETPDESTPETDATAPTPLRPATRGDDGQSRQAAAGPGPARTSERESTGLRQRLHRTLIQEIDQSALAGVPAEEARAFVQQAVRQLIDREVPAGRAGFRERLLQQLVDDVLGLGPLEPLLRDPTISEIMVNGPHRVYVERAGKLSPVDVHFQDDSHVVHVIERILAPAGRTIDEATPMVDARLPDGSRVNAVIPPASITGPLLTIRKFVADRLTAQELIASGSLTPESGALLAAAVRAGLNIIVSGGTGSGKTTMLNVLSSWIPSDQRIVTIEDPAELSLRQPHVVALEARPGHGGWPLHQADLLRNALRMRPDRIVVGETRGAEAFDMLQAMNTGHEGSLSTVHANSPRDAIRRIENMVMMAGYDLPVRAIREQITSAIDLVLQVARLRDGSRRTVAISEVVGMEDTTVTMQDLFLFEQRGEEGDLIVGVLKPTGLRPTFTDRLRDTGIDLLDHATEHAGDAEEDPWVA